MIKVICNNRYCEHYREGECSRETIRLTNEGQHKVFLLSCFSYVYGGDPDEEEKDGT